MHADLRPQEFNNVFIPRHRFVERGRLFVPERHLGILTRRQFLGGALAAGAVLVAQRNLAYVTAPTGATTLAHAGTKIINADATVASTRVVTDSILANNVNQNLNAIVGFTPMSAAETTLISGTLSTNGGNVELFAGLLFQEGTTAGELITFRIRKDSITGTILQSLTMGQNQTANMAVGAFLMAVDSSPAASQTYVLTGQMSTAVGTGMQASAQLIAANRKR